MALPDILSDSDLAPASPAAPRLGGGLPDVLTEADFINSPSRPELLARSIWDVAKQFGSGATEGVGSLVGTLMDYNPTNPSAWVQTIERHADQQPTNTNMIEQSMAAQLPAPDEKNIYNRYARRGGQFIGPTVLTGGALGTIGSAAGAAAGSQLLEDTTGDKTWAPVIGAVLGGGAPSVFSNLYKGARSIFRPATAEQITGSAALAQKNLTGLTPQQIEQAILEAPADDLGKLMTTAEVTGNAGMAQIEKDLASVGNNAQRYAQLDKSRNLAREGIIEGLSDGGAANREEMMSALTERAGGVRKGMTDNASAAWQGLYPNTEIPVAKAQQVIGQILGEQEAGLQPGSKVRTLTGQILAPVDEGSEKLIDKLTTRQLQQIRSDALRLDRALPPDAPGVEQRLLGALDSEIDDAMEKGLKASGQGQQYNLWKDARALTAKEKEIFGRNTAGGYLLNENIPEKSFGTLIKGSAARVKQLRLAIDADPELMQQVKSAMLDDIPRDAQGNLTTARIGKYLEKNKSGLKELFGEEHFSSLTRILDDLRSQDRVQITATLASRGNSVTAQKQTVAGAIESVLTDSLMPGVGPVGKLVRFMQESNGQQNAESVRSMLFEAALNPKAALELAKAPTTERVMSLLGRIGLGARQARDAGARTGLLEFFRKNSGPQSTALESGKDRSPSIPQTSELPPSGLGQSSIRSEYPMQSRERPASNTVIDSASREASTPTIRQQAEPQAAGTSYIPPKLSNVSVKQSAGNAQSAEALRAAVIQVESGGRDDAVSPKGAIGKMQVTPIAMREVIRSRGGDDSKYTDAELRDIARKAGMSEAFGTAYLQYLLDKYGDTELALAAYNGGPGRVDRLLKKTGGDSFDDIKSQLPSETSRYVPSVLSRLNIRKA